MFVKSYLLFIKSYVINCLKIEMLLKILNNELFKFRKHLFISLYISS